MAREKEIIEIMVREVAMLRGLNPKFTQSYNNLARRYFRQSARAHLDFMDDVYRILDLPTFDSTVEAAPSRKKVFITHPARCTCGQHDHVRKVYSESEIEGINREFINIFGKEVARKLDRRAQEFLLQVMHSSRVEPGVNNSGIFQPMYFNSVVNGGDDAFQKAKEVWERLSQPMKDQHPFDLNPQTIFIKDQKWIKEMYLNGYNLVSAKITKEFLPGIQKIMKNAFLKDQLNGLPMNKDQVARLLNERFGAQINPYTGRVEGGLPHWQRLVRTEMKSAIDKSQYERFKQAEIPYVQMSIAQNACEVCQWYANQNDGYYPLEQAPNIPEDTHPNCRCSELPAYSLPRGINEDHVFVPYPRTDKKITIEMIRKANCNNQEYWVAKFTQRNLLLTQSTD